MKGNSFSETIEPEVDIESELCRFLSRAGLEFARLERILNAPALIMPRRPWEPFQYDLREAERQAARQRIAALGIEAGELREDGQTEFERREDDLQTIQRQARRLQLASSRAAFSEAAQKQAVRVDQMRCILAQLDKLISRMDPTAASPGIAEEIGLSQLPLPQRPPGFGGGPPPVL